MPRGGVRKPLGALKGDMTVEKQQAKAASEETAAQHSVALLDPDKPPSDCKLKNAKIEWKIVVSYLRDHNFYGDVDVASVIGYCNAVAMYKKAWRDLSGEDDVIQTEKGPVINPKVMVIEKWSKEMTSCMNRAGFSPSARLSIGEKAFKDKQKAIEDRFGAI